MVMVHSCNLVEILEAYLHYFFFLSHLCCGHHCCSQQLENIANFIFSSPEHEVLMVSYCGQWLSVVRRRATCVVRQHLMFTL